MIRCLNCFAELASGSTRCPNCALETPEERGPLPALQETPTPDGRPRIGMAPKKWAFVGAGVAIAALLVVQYVVPEMPGWAGSKVGSSQAAKGPLPAAGAISDSRSSSPDPSAVSAGQTAISFQVPDCEGCHFTAFNTTAKKPSVLTWISPPIHNGTATITVPTGMTQDMSFNFDSPSGITLSHSRPDLVLGYAGVPAGTHLSAQQAVASPTGTFCWAGTTMANITIAVSSYIFPHKNSNVDSGDRIFWASPSTPVDESQWQPTFSGGLGDQEAPYCTATPRQ